MKNRTFQHAIYSLLHPLSIAAICLLLWNDHWLRVHYPSWLSGKLGDFAWLIFAPFVCAAVLAWLVPQNLKNHQHFVGLLSCIIVGTWFGLAKTIPAVHVLTVVAWETIINGPISQRLDTTDLLALPALWLSWQIWRRVKAPLLKRSQLAIIIFALAIVATLASDDEGYYSYTDAGVETICSEGRSLVIYIPTGGEYVTASGAKFGNKLVKSYVIYTSTDGGQYWEMTSTLKIEGERKPESDHSNCSQSQNFLATSTIQYRWKPAQTIERSMDAGQHWTTVFDLYQLRQDVRIAYKPSGMGWDSTPDTSPGPHSGLIDPASGNIVFAMGWDGVLVHTFAGNWRWARVGGYGLDDLTDFGRVQGILFFEWWEAGGLIVLVFTTSVVYLHGGIYTAEKVTVTIGWIGWILIAFLLLPSSHQDYENALVVGLVALPLLLFALLLLIFTVFDFLRNYRQLLLPILGVGFATAVLYLFPLVLWTQGTIARYVSAMELALLLTGSGLFTGFDYLRKIVPKTKRKHAPNGASSTEESI